MVEYVELILLLSKSKYIQILVDCVSQENLGKNGEVDFSISQANLSEEDIQGGDLTNVSMPLLRVFLLELPVNKVCREYHPTSS